MTLNAWKLVFASAMALPLAAQAVVLVQTSDPGYYNNSIGTVLNDTNPVPLLGPEYGPFPVSNDGTFNFPTAPDLSAASGALGDWLTAPQSLNSNWNYLAHIPNQWAVGTEVAVIYKFDTLSATNVIAQFGVDNGIFAWLDGNYIGGGRAPGGVVLGEYTYQLGDFSAGTHYLHLLLEDHGTTNGYAVNVSADTFVPPPTSVPEPATLSLLGAGLASIGLMRKRKKS